MCTLFRAETPKAPKFQGPCVYSWITCFIILQGRHMITVASQIAGISKHCIHSSLRGQNARHFAGDIFRCIFVNEKFYILIQISLKFVSKGPIDNNLALV